MVDIVNRSIDQFSAGFAIWRVTDQVIVYANQHALDAFGGTAEMFAKTSLWDIIGPLDTNLILAESIRSSPHGGPDIHLPDEAFVTFKRIDNGELFSGWFRAKDIVDEDGNTNFQKSWTKTAVCWCTILHECIRLVPISVLEPWDNLGFKHVFVDSSIDLDPNFDKD